MKKIYCIVISSLDEFGNCIDAFEMACHTDFEIIKQFQSQYIQRVRNGEFPSLGKNLRVDLEVRNFETNDLIKIIKEV